MQQIFCPLCGTALAASAKFCGNCGNSLAVEKPAPKAKTTSAELVPPKAAGNTQPGTEPILKEMASTVNLKVISTEKLDPLSPESVSAMKRYQGAYKIARLTDIAGHLFKAIGIFMAIAALI